MTFDEICKCFDANGEGNQKSAICPAHNDNENSLCLKKTDTKTLIYCQAGCDTEKVLAKKKLKLADLYLETQSSKWNIDKVYNYVDEDNNLIFQTVRFNPKNFRQRHKENNKWIYNLKGCRRVIYRLPEVVRSKSVLIVEGEKDCETARSYGLTATTCPMGAGKWKSEYDQYFDNKRIVVIPDNDSAGIESAIKVATSLRKRDGVESLKVLNLPVPEKGDLSSWMVNGGNRERLVKLISECPEWKQEKVENLDVFLDGRCDDLANAEALDIIYKNTFKYCKAYDWLKWDGNRWETSNAKERLQGAMTQTLLARRLEGVKNDHEPLIKFCKPLATKIRNGIFMYQSLESPLIEVNEFDDNPDYLNCENGILNLKTGHLEKHNPDMFFTNTIPVKFNNNTDFSNWTKILNDITGDESITRYLQLATGYSLTGRTKEECLFYIWGKTRCGKGTFTETIMAMLGKPLAYEVDFETFASKRGDSNAQNFDLAPLKPCRFVTASESDKYSRLNTQKIKRLTGGNEVYCAYKGKDMFGYRPQYKFFLTSNYPPNADADDDATWNRVKVIQFPFSFEGNEDVTLKERLRTSEMLQEVLKWAVDGAKELYEKWGKGERLETPEKIKIWTEQARSEYDYVQKFIDDLCVINKDFIDNNGKIEPGHTFIANKELKDAWNEWSDDNGIEPQFRKKLTGLKLSLKLKGFPTPKNGFRPKTLSNVVRGVVGLRLKTPIEIQQSGIKQDNNLPY